MWRCRLSARSAGLRKAFTSHPSSCVPSSRRTLQVAALSMARHCKEVGAGKHSCMQDMCQRTYQHNGLHLTETSLHLREFTDTHCSHPQPGCRSAQRRGKERSEQLSRLDRHRLISVLRPSSPAHHRNGHCIAGVICDSQYVQSGHCCAVAAHLLHAWEAAVQTLCGFDTSCIPLFDRALLDLSPWL